MHSGATERQSGRSKANTALDPGDAAKQVLIAYRQLSEIVKASLGYSAAKAHLDSYNRILETLSRCFSIDSAFSEAISHLEALHPPTSEERFEFAQQMASDGSILLATAHTFIELYLSPEDKRKAIGFHAS